MSKTLAWLDDMAGERPPAETLARYATWAETYDEDVKIGGVTGPPATCKFITTLGLKKDAATLDAGAGTGKLGKLLKAEGFSNLHALDGSAEMLKMAQKDNTYQSYTQGILGEGHTTTLPDNEFDAIVMVGVFAPGHFGTDVFPELIRIAKPGGIICWGQRNPKMYAEKSDVFKGDNFHNAVLEVCKAKNCVLEKGPVLLPNYYQNYDGFGYVIRKN